MVLEKGGAMAITHAHVTIGVFVVSISFGLLIYFVVADQPNKKRYMEQIFSQLMNFIIYLWIGKILLNLTLFIKEPMTILAYPSDSNAFYLAVLFSIVTVGIQVQRKKIDIVPFLQAFITVFLLSSFMYEFIQIVWNNHLYSVQYMGFLVFLIIVLITLRSYTTMYVSNIMMLIGWTLGMWGLSYTMPVTKIFNYTIASWFLELFFVFCLLVIILNRRKKVS